MRTDQAQRAREAVTRADPPYKYEELASFITHLVAIGTLRPGTRAPSLRQLCRQQHVSLSTVLQAYRLLEDRGVLEAKPQSGYYVARRDAVQLGKPAPSRPPARATTVAISAVVVKLLEHASDPRLVPLGCAIPDAELLAAGRLNRFLARAARMHGDEHNVYTQPKGDSRLRQEISRRAVRWGQALSADDIVITFGCTEALTLALRTLCKPADTVAIESPVYFGLLHTLESLGLKAYELPMDPSSGVDVPALARALETRSVKACLLSSSLNNPLGCTTSQEKKIEILDLIARHDVPLIEDDIYGDIHFDGERPRPFMACDRRGNTLYCSSFSKTIAPGYRVGWIVPGRHMQKVLEHKLATTLCGTALPQAALADFLSSGGYDSHLRRIRRTFQDNIDQTIRCVERHFPEGTRVTRPAGGFVLWLELPRRVNTRELFDEALERGICFVPGDVFSASRRYANCLRLSCGHRWQPRIERGIKTLGEMVQAATTHHALNSADR